MSVKHHVNTLIDENNYVLLLVLIWLPCTSGIDYFQFQILEEKKGL
jgi:hypothetical protein